MSKSVRTGIVGKKEKTMKKGWGFMCLLLCIGCMMACGKQETVDRSRVYNVYALNKEETKIFSNEYTVQSVGQKELIDELLGQLMTVPEKLEYKAPLNGDFEMLDYSFADGQLILNFDERYKHQPVTTEVLIRAAVVRTMTQVEGVDYVSFQVESQPLTDTSGSVIGIMSSDMFIDNAESAESAKEKVKVRLYFANEAGDRLVETTHTLYSNNSNVSVERLVVEQLIQGPAEQVKGTVFPTINPDTRIVGVTVKDGTCYVNFNENFLTQVYNVTSDVTIYSIVNSLVELPNVSRVQIAINGDSNVMYRENTSLAVTYVRNLDLVTALEE